MLFQNGLLSLLAIIRCVCSKYLNDELIMCSALRIRRLRVLIQLHVHVRAMFYFDLHIPQRYANTDTQPWKRHKSKMEELVSQSM